MGWGRTFLTATILAGAIPMASAPSLAAAGPAATYRLQGGPDVASELVLKPDGTFTYFLSAGSLDEAARGRWLVDGRALRLTTTPKPLAPLFSVGTVTATRDVALELHVTGPKGGGIAAVDLRVGFETGDVVEGYTQDYGWTLPDTEKRVPLWVEFAVPIHALISQRFAIDTRKGNVLTFVLTPNDLGVVDFSGVEIGFSPGRVVMHRGGGDLVFEKTK